ncbi:MAG: outer membrane protein OmpK [Fusobacteriaceae bacterium]
MKKLSIMISALILSATSTFAKEVVPAPVATVEPTVVIVEKESETVVAPVSKDFKFVNFNMIHGREMTGIGKAQKDTYLEIEIGGRKGAFDLYGYIDFSDTLHNSRFSDENKDSDVSGNSNFFAELKPRVSMNDVFSTDLSVGPIKEVYLAGYLKAGDGGLWVNGLGLGTDIQVPWLGKMGLNAYALYVAEDFGSTREGEWDGFMVANNWFKPVYFFNNGTFLSYQGYANYSFDINYNNQKDNYVGTRTTTEFQLFNGFFWHSSDYALGYGLKYTRNMMNVKDGSFDNVTQRNNDANGFSHFFIATYKF